MDAYSSMIGSGGGSGVRLPDGRVVFLAFRDKSWYVITRDAPRKSVAEYKTEKEARAAGDAVLADGSGRRVVIECDRHHYTDVMWFVVIHEKEKESGWELRYETGHEARKAMSVLVGETIVASLVTVAACS